MTKLFALLSLLSVAALAADGGTRGTSKAATKRSVQCAVPVVPDAGMPCWHVSKVRHSLPNHSDWYDCHTGQRKCDTDTFSVKVDCKAKHGPYWDKKADCK